MGLASLWDTLRIATGQPDVHPGFWGRLREKLDLALSRPVAAPGVISSRLTGREGVYYVLKNPATRTYYRLSERDHFLWERMDGSCSVKDLVVAYFLEYGSFAFSRVASLVLGLKAALFLQERPTDLYFRIQGRLRARSPGYPLSRVWRAFLQQQFAINGLDRFVGVLHRWGGRLLFTWPFQILFLALSIAGIYAFAQVFRSGRWGVVTINGSLGLGVVGLVVANGIGLFLHETAHALTVKHYGREVRRGGFMIYLGMPAFFVDTTDIWLEGKRARLAVTWAGPYSGLILGGLASILILLQPEAPLNAVLFQFAFLSFILVFFNLNPLLELDGYYLLMDWLEIPMLRTKSLAFIRGGLWAKLREIRRKRALPSPAGNPAAGAPEEEGRVPDRGLQGLPAAGSSLGLLGAFSREEKIFAVFGFLSSIWTLFALYLGASTWQKRLAGAVRDLWAQGGSGWKIVLALFTAALSLLFMLAIGFALLNMARGVLRRVERWGFLATMPNRAALLVLVGAGLALGPTLLGQRNWLPFVGLAALVLATCAAVRAARGYAGSRLATVFWLLGAFSLTMFLGEAAALTASRQLLPPQAATPTALALRGLGSLCLLAVGCLLFARTPIRQLSAGEKALLGLGLVAVCGVAVWAVTGPWLAAIPPLEGVWTLPMSLIPLLVLTLLVPTLFSFWHTVSGPAWVVLGLSWGVLAVGTLAAWPATLAWLLLAASLLLHLLALRQVTFLHEEPRPEIGLGDRHRLQRTFSWTAGAVLAQFRQAAGERAARAAAERFNAYALAAGWPIRVVDYRFEDALDREMGLIDLGQAYAAALNLLLAQVTQELGARRTARALQRAYDRLPWEEREVGSLYLFVEVDQAEALSSQFRAIRNEYQTLLQRMPLFATMDAAEIELLCSRLKVERFAPGRAIIRQGERGDRFYIIRQGHVEVSQRDERGVSRVVNQLERGDYFGELALLRDAPRNATCRATVPTEVLSLGRSDFDHLVRARFSLRDKVDRSISLSHMLRRMPLFAELDGQQIQHVVARLQEEVYDAGELIIREGEIGETFYVIESGRVQVFSVTDGREQVIAERGPGEYVGEIALLLRIPRTAAVRTLLPTRVWTLHREEFDQLVAEHLYVSKGLERETSRRLIDLRQAASRSQVRP
jgi:putative peptide zinc metalloprotease protein